MKSACLKAGLKLGIGLLVVGSVVGIRIVAVSAVDRDRGAETSGVEAEARALESVSEPLPSAPEASASGNQDASMRGGTPDAREPQSGPVARSRSGDQMVSCRFSDAVHFMTADDCAMRGGRAQIFESDR